MTFYNYNILYSVDSDTDSDSSGKTYVDTAPHTKQGRFISHLFNHTHP